LNDGFERVKKRGESVVWIKRKIVKNEKKIYESL